MTMIAEINGYPKNIRQSKYAGVERKSTLSGSDRIVKSDLAKPFDKTDSVEISKTAHSVYSKLNYVKKYSSIIKQPADLSRVQIESITNRIGSGYYDKPEIISKIATKLTDANLVEGSNSQATIFRKTINSEPRTAAHEKIYARIHEGFYNTQEVSDEIVNKLIDPDYI